jgi:hypothetical protein
MAQRADFRLIRPYKVVAELLQLILVKKNSIIIRHAEEKAEGCQRTRIFQKQPGKYSEELRKTQKTTFRQNVLSITNAFERHKITDLTRPNKLSTMTNKVATRSPKRTWFWKRLHSPSCYTAEHTLIDYIVFFKGRVQCIQDWCQRHNKAT